MTYIFRKKYEKKKIEEKNTKFKEKNKKYKKAFF